MRVSIFGIGYVGSVCAGCLAGMGHEITCVDANVEKVMLINNAASPVVERGLDELIRQGVESNLLRATTEFFDAVQNSEITLICVGTPSEKDGKPNLSYLYTVARQIGSALRDKQRFHVVVVRSTVPPGTMEQVEKILAESSDKTPGIHFGVAVDPEFLREGSAIQDFNNPPFTLVGTRCTQAAELLRELYASIQSDIIDLPPGTAEMVKYASNSFHALKVAFANEIGRICKKRDIDGNEVMDIFCRDSNLNISSAYLRPGLSYGGSCLPKDLSALTGFAHDDEIEIPVLSHVDKSNKKHLEHAIDLILSRGCNRVGILGLSFKPETDDVRGSPLVSMVSRLMAKGHLVKVYDPNIDISRLIGANKLFADSQIHHLHEIMAKSADEIIEFAECIVIGHATAEFADAAQKTRHDQYVIDLVRIDPLRKSSGSYSGLCW